SRDSKGSIDAKENTVMGTPDFLSPEQARNLSDVDIRSDLYGLGCTFYFLLTGDVPFPGGPTLEKLLRHCTEEPVPLAKVRPEVPKPVIDIVKKLMAKAPEDRFQTPLEVVEVVSPFVGGSSGFSWNEAVQRADASLAEATPVPAPGHDSDGAVEGL